MCNQNLLHLWHKDPLKLQTNLYTHQKRSTCWTFGNQTLINPPILANIGDSASLHSSVTTVSPKGSETCPCCLSDCQEPLTPAPVTVILMVPRQLGKPHQRTVSQSINRYSAPVLSMWTTTLATQPCFLLSLLCTSSVSVQVFFCSRTHSQLSQFVSELQRTTFADTIASVSLASRKVSSVPIHCQALSNACRR